MSEFFLKIINMSISASWLVIVVLAFRFLFRKAPKWVNVLLWGIVAVRLICPFAIESSVSLIPDSVGNGELVAKWADDYIDDVDIHHPGSVYYDAAVGAGREPISDGEGGYYVVTKHDQLGWKKSTTYPVIKRLGERGVLENNNGTITSLVSKDEAQAYEIGELVEKKFEGSLPAFVAAFTKHQKISEEELDEVQRMIDRIRKGG